MSKFRPYGSAATREVRRIRILAGIRDGSGFDEIARRERITRERVRQIVGETLRRDDVSKDEHWRVQSARLEPALRLAARGIENGKLQAIGPLLKVWSKSTNTARSSRRPTTRRPACTSA